MAVADLARSLLADAIEHTSDGFVLFDADDRLAAYNSKYQEFYGYTDEDLKEVVTWRDLYEIDDRRQMDAPALGVEERRDEAPRGGASHARPTPDPEVVAKPKRRKFTAQYRLRILEEAESCTQPGEVGRLLRREGLYSSHLTEWRRARREGSLQGLTPSKRGRKPAERNPLSAKVHKLEAKVARLEKELHTAHTILDVQGKVAGLLGFSLEHGKDC